VDFVLAYRKPGCAGHARRVVLVGFQAHDEDPFLDVFTAQRFLGSLGDDPLVGFTVDHDLPAAGAHGFTTVLQRFAFVARLFPDRQSPLFEIVHRIVDVPADIENQVLAGNAHQVPAHVAHVVHRVVFAHVGIDRGQAHGHGAGTVHGGFVHQLHREVYALRLGGLDPLHDFESGAATRHTAADQQNVDFFLDDFGVTEVIFAHSRTPCRPAPRDAGPAVC
jgi:hypothetical protein